MQSLTRESLLSLEDYARQRPELRRRVIDHKRRRTLHLGEHVTLLFEDETTIRYQVQEMLRIERIFEEDGIRGELEAYTPLVPDGSNWKATLMIEYADESQRRAALVRLRCVEQRVWLRVAGSEPVFAIADEDLERDNAHKTSAVHFLRFELAPDMIRAAQGGAALSAGVDHPACRVTVEPLPESLRQALVEDLRI